MIDCNWTSNQIFKQGWIKIGQENGFRLYIKPHETFRNVNQIPKKPQSAWLVAIGDRTVSLSTFTFELPKEIANCLN